MSNVVNETARKTHAKRLGLPENTSWAEMNDHLTHQHTSKVPRTNAVIQTTKASWNGDFSPAGV